MHDEKSPQSQGPAFFAKNQPTNTNSSWQPGKTAPFHSWGPLPEPRPQQVTVRPRALCQLHEGQRLMQCHPTLQTRVCSGDTLLSGHLPWLVPCLPVGVGWPSQCRAGVLGDQVPKVWRVRAGRPFHRRRERPSLGDSVLRTPFVRGLSRVNAIVLAMWGVSSWGAHREEGVFPPPWGQWGRPGPLLTAAAAAQP